MSVSQPNQPPEPSDDGASGHTTKAERPDWLMGAEEGARRRADAPRSGPRAAGPRRPRKRDAEAPPSPPGGDASSAAHGGTDTAHLKLVAPPSTPLGPTGAPATEDAPPADAPASATAVVWKAAHSSIPRLKEQPVAVAGPSAREAPTDFAQDEVAASRAAESDRKASKPTNRRAGDTTAREATAGGPPGGAPPEAVSPLDQPPGLLAWLDHLRVLLRPPVAIAAASVLALGIAVACFLHSNPRGATKASLARIRQQPEAFEGRVVVIDGRAGETFPVGQSFVFDLYQGRDTIVVYSRTRRPQANEAVTVRGTISVGYMDGVPRLALLEATGGR